MLEYYSKCFTKSLSLFGELKLTIINKIKQYTYIDENNKILIPNCQDGIYVLPFAKISSKEPGNSLMKYSAKKFNRYRNTSI